MNTHEGKSFNQEIKDSQKRWIKGHSLDKIKFDRPIRKKMSNGETEDGFGGVLSQRKR